MIGEILKNRRFPVSDTFNLDAGAFSMVTERVVALGRRELQFRGRNRIAVRIDLRIAEYLGDALSEPIAE